MVGLPDYLSPDLLAVIEPLLKDPDAYIRRYAVEYYAQLKRCDDHPSVYGLASALTGRGADLLQPPGTSDQARTMLAPGRRRRRGVGPPSASRVAGASPHSATASAAMPWPRLRLTPELAAGDRRADQPAVRPSSEASAP